MKKENRYLFIAGASRSGTTLLMNLLDAQRELLIFPLEHKVFSKFFTVPESARREYFTKNFITERTEGQQTVLASRELFEQYRRRIRREFGTNFELDVDSERFLRRYREVLGETEISLESILNALTEALVSSNPQAAADYAAATYVVYKDPFTTEFFAQRAAAELPSAKFLHIIRDPYARYCSIKKRHLSRGRVLKREVSRRINFRDFASGYAEQAIASLHSGLATQRQISSGRYLIMRFEDLVDDPRESLQKIGEWLGVELDASASEPSKLGKPVESGSSFSPVSGIDTRATDRGKQYFFEMTSASERDVYNRCLAASKYSRFYNLMEPDGREASFFTWARPYKHERIRDYCWRIATRQGVARRSDTTYADGLADRLPALYLNGRI